MRLFIAIEIPDEIRSGLMEAQRRLKGSGVEASWPRPEGIHLTLKFMGDVPEEKIAEILKELRQAVEGTAPFRLEVGGVGAFPGLKNARVAWIGLSGETESLARLQVAVEHAMVRIGMAREDRKFTPHLTLGRIKYIRSRDKWLEAVEEVKDIKLAGFDVVSISLMKSELKPSGAVYAEMGRIELQ
jgi:RNA 2',3'-cyclic 3'-phosphodiesterase